MERKIINKENLANLFAKNEIEAATLLRDALMDVRKKCDEITDPAIKNYNAMENEFMLNISLTTIKNYASKNGYGIFNVDGNACVVKQFDVDSYKELKREFYDSNENKGDKVMDNKNNLTASEKLAVNYIRKIKEYKEQDAISIRCATSVNARLQAVYSKYSMFQKQFIISYLLDIALIELENSEEK